MLSLLAPGDRSFLGGGLFASMFKDATEMVRNYIVENGELFNTIIKNDKFKAYFTVKGEGLKNVPKGYDPAHPQAEYLKLRSWYLEYPVPDERVLAADFVKKAAQIFSVMKPYNDYLNIALKEFTMPTR